MDFPVHIGIGSFKLSAHFIFETLAFIIGYQYFVRIRKNSNDVISTDNRIWIIIGAVFGAFFFSRLVGALESPAKFIDSETPLLYFFVSKTIVGGLFGGLIGVELIKKIIGEKSSSGDLFTYPIILGMMIGRIGCFSAGVYEETYGIESNLPWAMNLGDGLLRHPVALYEIIFLGLLWLFLKRVESKKSFISGYRFQFFMIAYFIFRFLLDFIKPGNRYFLGIGTIQITCLIGLLYYSKTIAYICLRPDKMIKK